MTTSLALGFGLTFDDLYRRDGLVRLDGAFVDVLAARSPQLHKRLFVQRRAAKKYTAEQAAAFDGPALRRELERRFGGALTELRFAEKVDAWMTAEADHAEPGSSAHAALELAARYAAWATHTPE